MTSSQPTLLQSQSHSNSNLPHPSSLTYLCEGGAHIVYAFSPSSPPSVNNNDTDSESITETETSSYSNYILRIPKLPHHIDSDDKPPSNTNININASRILTRTYVDTHLDGLRYVWISEEFRSNLEGTRRDLIDKDNDNGEGESGGRWALLMLNRTVFPSHLIPHPQLLNLSNEDDNTFTAELKIKSPYPLLGTCVPFSPLPSLKLNNLNAKNLFCESRYSKINTLRDRGSFYDPVKLFHALTSVEEFDVNFNYEGLENEIENLQLNPLNNLRVFYLSDEDGVQSEKLIKSPLLKTMLTKTLPQESLLFNKILEVEKADIFGPFGVRYLVLEWECRFPSEELERVLEEFVGDYCDCGDDGDDSDSNDVDHLSIINQIVKQFRATKNDIQTTTSPSPNTSSEKLEEKLQTSLQTAEDECKQHIAKLTRTQILKALYLHLRCLSFADLSVMITFKPFPFFSSSSSSSGDNGNERISEEEDVARLNKADRKQSITSPGIIEIDNKKYYYILKTVDCEVKGVEKIGVKRYDSEVAIETQGGL